MRARIVDEHDIDVPVGEVGELVLRTEPWGIFAGYHRKPEATAEAFRNLWFHTGDGFRRDAEDNFYFVDRVKDAIRRRGENISSFEVEAAVNSHPDVQESAAIGIAVPGEEQEIKVFAVRRGTALPTHTDLAGHLAERLPRFMVPRYLEFVDALPKTEASNRIKKAVLRERGLTGQTWDCTSGHLVEG
jgi:crotonobetaine/carnitine-CoA ligase